MLHVLNKQQETASSTFGCYSDNSKIGPESDVSWSVHFSLSPYIHILSTYIKRIAEVTAGIFENVEVLARR